MADCILPRSLEIQLSTRPTDLRLSLSFSLMKCLIAGFAFWMVWLDVSVFNTEILEISFTEITQEVMLLLCAWLFWSAPAPGARGGFDVLAAGFFAALLMRELDGLFDPISHSAWLWPCLAIAGSAVFFALKPANRRRTATDLAAFMRSPTFAALSTGMAVLIFSRVFGMGVFWHHILGEGYARLAKTAVEEGVELMAYSIWLCACLEHWVRRRLRVSEPVAAHYAH